MTIPFNKPNYSNQGIDYIKKVIESGKIGADGNYTRQCRALLQEKLGVQNILMTTSCTHALELALMLIDIKEDDEVIMPSYTFPSTANSVLMHKGRVVFTEINQEDLCIDANQIEEKITPRTKAIIVVHYGGNACDMDKIMAIADKHKLYVIEDAAQGLFSTYKGQQLGTIGHFGCYSFHETKNLSSGEGGAIVIGSEDEAITRRAEYIRQKGTNRMDFERGQVDFYQWVDIGSSYCPSEILMAYLYAQLENRTMIHERRLHIFNRYLALMRTMNSDKIHHYSEGNQYGDFNAHIFYIIFKNETYAANFAKALKEKGIMAYTHLIPLHLSKMGLSMGYKAEDFPYEQKLYKRLIRLPLYADMTEDELCKVEKSIMEVMDHL